VQQFFARFGSLVLERLRRTEIYEKSVKIFVPQMDPNIQKAKYKSWQEAVKRSYNWC
jgi:glycerol kinase